MAKKKNDLRLYIHLPIRAYKDPKLQQHRQALFVLAALCAYTDPRGICFPNQLSLAKDLNVSRQAISRYIKRLIEWGYVKYARKQFRGQRGNSYFVVYDKNTSESQACKNTSLAKHDIPIIEQEIAKQTLDKTVDNSGDKLGKGNPQVAQVEGGRKGNGNTQVAPLATSGVARNDSINVNNNINWESKAKQTMQIMCKAVNQIYAKDISYDHRQILVVKDWILKEGLIVDDQTLNKMKEALLWFREREPMKDVPKHINFYKPWLIKQTRSNKTKDKIQRLGSILKYKSKRNV
jgi:hypothetical protein